MPLTLSSMFQTLLQLLQCNRRLTKSTSMSRSKRDVNPCKNARKRSNYQSDASTTDYASDHYGTNHSEDSDWPSTYFQAPPGLAPPPGLNHRAPWRMEQAGRRPTASYQPSLHQRHQKQADNDTFVALKEALDKLAPTEIAAVRSLLDSKACNAGAGTPSRNSGWATSRNPVGSSLPVWDRVNARPSKYCEMSCVDTGETLQTFLAELALIDDSRVVLVRKINVLGFDSAPMLQDYFSKFGAVDRVMVAPTRVTGKASFGSNFGKTRARPPGQGFVVMQTSEGVEAVLKYGETHSLAGVDIKACPFKSHSIDGKD